MTRITADALYRLLPAVHRLRDADEGGPLRALVGVLAREGAVIEEDIEQLLDNLFIETCADWAAPYVGGTIGYRALLRGRGPACGDPRRGREHHRLPPPQGHRRRCSSSSPATSPAGRRRSSNTSSSSRPAST